MKRIITITLVAVMTITSIFALDITAGADYIGVNTPTYKGFDTGVSLRLGFGTGWFRGYASQFFGCPSIGRTLFKGEWKPIYDISVSGSPLSFKTAAGVSFVYSWGLRNRNEISFDAGLSISEHCFREKNPEFQKNRNDHRRTTVYTLGSEISAGYTRRISVESDSQIVSLMGRIGARFDIWSFEKIKGTFNRNPIDEPVHETGFGGIAPYAQLGAKFTFV